MKRAADLFFVAFHFFVRAPLYQLIAAQVFFLLLGKSILDFNILWVQIGCVLFAAMATELVLYNVTHFLRTRARPVLFFPASAVAAALGIAIFFRAVHPLYFLLTGFLAIASKYFIAPYGRHVFNPSNFAIVTVALIFSNESSIEFTQWGSSPYLYLLIAAMCLTIAYRAGVIVTTISFLASYSIFLSTLVPFVDTFTLHNYGIIGPSLMLFSSFMITDPKTSPTGFWARIFHGISVACLFFFLEAWFVRYSLFIASFLISIFNVISRSAVSYLQKREYVPLQIQQNALSFVFAIVLMTTVVVGIFSKDSMRAPEFVSLRFLFMGVESSVVRSCSTQTMFEKRITGLETGAFTTGASWGDFDTDGYDDIIISSSKMEMHLYHNERNGTFTDATISSGLPHIRSSSAFFADYNNDGAEDLFVVDGVVPTLQSRQIFGPDTRVRAIRIFKNEHAHFREVTNELGLNDFMKSLKQGSLTFADYDNDGYLDMVFAQNATELDITPPQNRALEKSLFDNTYHRSGTTLCDAKKELVAIEKLDITPDLKSKVRSFIESGGCLLLSQRLFAFGNTAISPESPLHPPFAVRLLDPGAVYLFRNDHGQRFVEVPSLNKTVNDIFDRLRTRTESHTIGVHPYNFIGGQYYQPLSFDYDSDGRPDIFLSIDHGANLLLRNDGQLHFSDVTPAAHIDYAGSGMGADIADFNNDGLVDLVADNNTETYVFSNTGGGTFGAYTPTIINRYGGPWGISSLDYNLDGSDDIYIGNSSITLNSRVPATDIVRRAVRADRLYENDGHGEFRDVSSSGICTDSRGTLPVAVSDFDNDGDPDIFVGTATLFPDSPEEEKNIFYVDTIPHTDHHYLEIRLRGTTSNADAVGAIVHVRTGSRVETKFLHLGSSFNAENSKTLLFGLGSSSVPVAVDVVWPSGRKTTLKNVRVDQRIDLQE